MNLANIFNLIGVAKGILDEIKPESCSENISIAHGEIKQSLNSITNELQIVKNAHDQTTTLITQVANSINDLLHTLTHEEPNVADTKANA